ncbi:HPP family-domain-containing protein [Umbelopsis sp. PMI_123]|nr:HPP family-domain-containing protein [Umbelopsis sp. PMI_123]
MMEIVKSVGRRFLLGSGPRPTRLPQWRISAWSFIGAFACMTTLELLFSRTLEFENANVPMIIASFGASAVLVYGAVESPLGQPRNLFFGQIISAVIGVCITALFQLSPNFENLRWLAGSLSMAVALVAMQWTGTVHPPGGATALIAATQNDIGWLYIGIVALSAAITTVIALLINNIERRWPVYWWAPTKIIVTNKDETIEASLPDSISSHELTPTPSINISPANKHHVLVSATEIILPAHLSQEDREFLKSLQNRLKEENTPMN